MAIVEVFKAAIVRQAQPQIKARPPIGVIIPSHPIDFIAKISKIKKKVGIAHPYDYD
ncbi:hypothetical protein [Planktothrix tepida]|uniref:hypothetical protein n=1 Tax=Planktothrix tepida TaxID=1678309 RepID=UPI0016477FB5|nr:hypothetical protein [Planktothrix tepida]